MDNANGVYTHVVGGETENLSTIRRCYHAWKESWDG